MTWKAGVKSAFKAFLLLTGVIFLICALFPLPLKKLEKDYSTVIRARDRSILFVTLSPHQTYRFHSPLSGISPYLVKGFIQCEDKYFYFHPGFNPVALFRALFQNLKAGRTVSGASTITMQIARMLEPKPRTVLNKLLEALRALQLEFFYSKDELLEIYLNTVPMGGNIQGVGAASWIYFGKEADQLSPAEAALLAGVPRSPDKRRPDRDEAGNDRVKNAVLDVFQESGIITGEVCGEARSARPEVAKRRLPFHMPHLVMRTLLENRRKFDILLSADPALQALVERIVRHYLSRVRKFRVNNLAVLVVDNHTMKVRAYIGSADFFDEANEGQNDGVLSRRSPGSTLKPFIYGRAMDHGLVTPASFILDIPRRFGHYQPKNYNQDYMGLVDARSALVHSLNVPAVEMLFRLAPLSAKTFLESIGVTGPPVFSYGKEHGLSVALGSYPVTLENLVAMYAALANNGSYRKVLYEETGQSHALKNIMSPEAAYMVTDILSGLRRPDLPGSWEFTTSLPRVAWKTGTSFGQSDAWSIGFNPDFTVGVWLGNFSGQGSPALVGIEIATPLLFSVFNEVARGSDKWFTKPEGLGVRKVCALSGAVPNKHCSRLIDDYYIPGISSEEPCALHKEIRVDRDTGYRVCEHCDKGKSVKEKVIVEYPPEFIAWAASRDLPLAKAVEHNPSCPRFASGDAPKIKFPLKGGVYYYREKEKEEEQALALEAVGGSDASRLFWFVNKEFLGESAPGGKIFFPLKPGKYKLTCLDSRGRSDEVDFSVYYR